MNRRKLSRRTALAVVSAAWLATSTPAVAAPPEPASENGERRHDKEDHGSDRSREWRPALSLHYGFADPSRDGFGGKFGPAGQLDLQAGYVRERRLARRDDLVAQSTHGVIVSRFSSDLSSTSLAQDEVGLDTWRIGFTTASGSGYRFGSGNLRLVLQSADSGGWFFTGLSGQAVHHLAAPDSAILARYDTATRYGDSWESTVRLCLNRSLAVHLGYERTVVLPGFKTWYWLLSDGINLAALTVADEFVHAVEDASPHAAPVVAFLLRSGIEYGFYELRQKKMNWPFDTEAPLAFDTFKLGFGVAF